MKAVWNGYSAELDKLIEDVEPIPANYKCFVESVRVASRTHIVTPGYVDRPRRRDCTAGQLEEEAAW